MRPSVVKVAAWGPQFVQSLCDNILPCLLQPGNLPGLQKMSDTYLVLYLNGVPPSDYRDLATQVDAIPGLQTALLDVGIMLHLPPRTVLANTEIDSLRRAVSLNADWFDFQADTIIDANFLTTVKQLLTKHNAVLSMPFRSSRTKFNEIAGRRRDFDARELYQIALKAMHPVTLDYFAQKRPSHIPADPHQFFFVKNGRFTARSWQPRPYGLNAKMVADSDASMTIDCYLLNRIDRKHAYMQRSLPGDFYLTALDDDKIPEFGKFPVTAEGIAQSINGFAQGNKYVLKAYAWGLHQKVTYYTDTPPKLDCLTEHEVVPKVLKLIGQS